ncbi:hypothetical protein B0H14DRAFT_1515999 [Mycena olivaceomarginata]|nr:hypothetical protein B0H14DRAFT_1515999 [Mycena olivaceomarginata]
MQSYWLALFFFRSPASEDVVCLILGRANDSTLYLPFISYFLAIYTISQSYRTRALGHAKVGAGGRTRLSRPRKLVFRHHFETSPQSNPVSFGLSRQRSLAFSRGRDASGSYHVYILKLRGGTYNALHECSPYACNISWYCHGPRCFPVDIWFLLLRRTALLSTRCCATPGY